MAIHKEPVLRIAYFSPLPPARSGIADYSSELLPYLANYANITLFTADPHEISPALTQQFSTQPIRKYPEQRWQYDITLYQMGNSAYHKEMYEMFRRFPGIVVLHDYGLHQFIAYLAAANHKTADYSREVAYELGSQGIAYIRQAQAHTLHNAPLNRRLLDLSLGVIVHSDYVRNLILARGEKTAVTVIPHQMTTFTGKSRHHQLPFPENAVIFASVGQVTSAKQIEFALRAFKKVRQTNPHAYYFIVGEETKDMNLSNIIHTLDLSDYVHHIGYVADKETFTDWIYTADVIINLRYPTIGETSSTALRALAAGRPLILFDHGWYSELPDSTCIKTAPLDEDALIEAMATLASQPELRQRLGKSGQQHITAHHHPTHVADAYLTFIGQRLSIF